MFAIAFDLNTENLREAYPGNHPNQAYQDIGTVLRRFGFRRMQGSLYYGDAETRYITVVRASRALQAEYPWFRESIADMRVLQITLEDNLIEYLDLE